MERASSSRPRKGQLPCVAGRALRRRVDGNRASGHQLPLSVARQLLFWVEPAGGRALFAADRFPIWLWDTEDGPRLLRLSRLRRRTKAARHHGGPATPRDRSRAVRA
jgi:sarcosine oxidase